METWRRWAVLASVIVIAVVAVLFMLAPPQKGSQPPQPPLEQVAASSQAYSVYVPGAVDEREALPPPDDAQPGLLRVYGTVTAVENGTPVAGAGIVASRRGRIDADAPETHTDEAGAFSLTVSPANHDGVTCRAAGFVEVRRPFPQDAAGEVRMDFFLRRGIALSGRVTDAQTGEGIGGARVTAVATGRGFMDRIQTFGEDRDRSARSAGDGLYMIDGLEPGSYRVLPKARALGYVTPEDAARTVSIELGKTYDNINFALQRGAVVRGRVTNDNGRPVPEANVNVMPASLIETAMKHMGAFAPDFFGGMADSTDTDGRFEILGVDYDVELRLHCDTEGYAATSTDPFIIARGESPVTVDIILTRGSRVSGMARLEDGAPAQNRELMLLPSLEGIAEGISRRPLNATTTLTGYFTFEGVGAGKYMVAERDRPPFTPFGQEGRVTQVEVDGINDVDGVEVTLRPDTSAGEGTIQGMVVSASGGPVSDARVTAKLGFMPMELASAVTGMDGTFTLEGLKGGEFILTATSDQGMAEQPDVAVGAQVTLRLQPASRVSGIVVDDHGAPVAACAVSMNEQGAQAETDAHAMARAITAFFGSSAGKATDDFGAFEFAGIKPGMYVVRAKSASKGTGESSPFPVAIGQEVTGIRVVLAPGVRFGGRVEDGAGQPISGATVSLLPSGETDVGDMMLRFMPLEMQRTAGSAASDSTGGFIISNVPPGPYTVVATHNAYARMMHPSVPVAAGQDITNFRIVMTRGGRAQGQYAVDGQPRAGVMLQFLGPAGMQMANTDSEGRFELTGLTPGTYLVNVIDMSSMTSGRMDELFRQRPRVVDVTDGEITEVDLGQEGGAVVSGTVTGQDLGTLTVVSMRRAGGPAPESLNPMDIQSAIEAARYSAGQAMVSPDGRFQIDGVQPGTYVLEVFSFAFDLANPDFSALMNASRAPRLRMEVAVADQPILLNLVLPQAQP